MTKPVIGTWVMRHPAPMKGLHVIGCGPLSGSPCDKEGRLILDYIYGPKPAPEPKPEEPCNTRQTRLI